jgi:hypothetical protein
MTIQEETKEIIKKFTYWDVTYCDPMGIELDTPYNIMSALTYVKGVLENIIVHSEEARLRRERFLEIQEILEKELTEYTN